MKPRPPNSEVTEKVELDPKKTDYLPSEFFPALDLLPKEGDAVICGGQAVNLLAAVFLSPEELEEITGEKGDAMSGDMDIIITKELQSRLEKTQTDKSKGFKIKRFADARQPIQFVILPDSMPDTRIDVLRTIKGIHTEKDRVFEDAIEIDAPFKVMNPITLMIAKAENCATLEQNLPSNIRNDIKHLKMMVPIVKNFLTELVTHCDPESKQDQREIISQLKKLLQAAPGIGFKKGFASAGMPLHDAVPIHEIKDSSLETLKKFFENTFLPQMETKGKQPPGNK